MKQPFFSSHTGRLLFAFSLVTAFCAACAGPAVVTRLYQIHDPAQVYAVMDDTFNASIGLGPITIPEYLDRQGMVIRESAHSIRYSQVHRWSQPLEQDIAASLVGMVQAKLPNARVYSFPWPPRQSPDTHIRIDIQRLDYNGTDAVELIALWQALDTRGNELKRNIARFKITVAKDDFTAIAAAYNQMLEKTADEIVRFLVE